MKLLLATTNAHKAEEVQAILAGTGISVSTLAAWPEIPEPPEDEPTFEGNALSKARFVFERTGVPVLADDSGLEVDALGGAPGVHSKRFSPEATGPANNALLLTKLAGVQERTARFRCVLAFVNGEVARTVEGRCEGAIAEAPRGEHGFGYDPLFLPNEAPGRTLAELSMAEKNRISHRGRAFERLNELLGEVAR